MLDARSSVVVLLVLVVCADSSLAQPAAISADLKSGRCLCVNEPNVPAYKDPSNPSSSFTTLDTDACFLSNGGVYHEAGNTLYELVDTVNRQTAWVDSFYLNVFLMSQCNSSVTDTKASHYVPQGPALDCIVYGRTYSHGEHFRLHGLYCTCDDGYNACSMKAHHCFADGIVYREGASFQISGRGSCTCNLGTLACDSNPPVG